MTSTRMDSERLTHATAVRTVPSRAGTATRVLMLVDDPDATTDTLALAIGGTPRSHPRHWHWPTRRTSA